MWTVPIGKPGGTPEQFNEHYLNYDVKRETHFVSIRELMRDVSRKTVLDLGGGTTLVVNEEWFEDQYTLVDFSIEACDQASAIFKKYWKRLGFDVKLNVHCMDVMDWLKTNTKQFDICLCFGLLEYLPATGLDDLLAFCPSNVLCLGVSAAESYLQYPGRITIYSAEDIEKATTDAGWKEVKRLPMPSHVWARYERIK